MSAEDKDSKTEEASEQKLRKAQQEGDSWTTREAGHAMGFLALLILALLILPMTLGKGLHQISALFDLAPTITLETAADLRGVMGQFARGISAVLLPIFAVMLACALVSIFLSGPFVLSAKRIEPKPSKLNPLSGFKRIYGPSNFIEFAKSLVKLVAVAVLMMLALRAAMDEILPGAVVLPEALAGFVGGHAARGLAMVVAMMLPILAFDFFWKRREWHQKQRMSKKEQRDEHKDSQGDPMIRMRRQEIGRKRLRRNLKKAVSEATLVVMNPTHYAVALRYERGVDLAPVCVAKGADLVALQIRDLALAAEVSVLESPPLARALHAVAEEDQPIPEVHWAAVAELVGYVLDLRRRVRRKLPEGTRDLS